MKEWRVRKGGESWWVGVDSVLAGGDFFEVGLRTGSGAGTEEEEQSSITGVKRIAQSSAEMRFLLEAI